MKLGIGPAFVIALAIHGVLLAVLAINVSLDKPKRPRLRLQRELSLLNK